MGFSQLYDMMNSEIHIQVHGAGGTANYSSPCFRKCYDAALNDRQQDGEGGIDAAAMTGTWEKAFDEEQPAKGGCPAITTLR